MIPNTKVGRMLLGLLAGLSALPVALAQAPMPPSGVCVLPCASGSGNDNPDAWPESGTVYVNRNYNTENLAADMPGAVPNPVHDFDWLSNIGRGRSGAWKAWPRPGGEQNSGWPNRWGSAQPRRIFHSFTMHISEAMYNNVWLAPGATWMKFLDLAQANSRSTSNHRWVTSLAATGRSGSNRVTGLQFGFNAGGAGTALYDDGINANPDLTQFIFDEFVWFCIVYDEANTSAHLYMKREGDPGVTKILFRDEGTVFGSEYFGSTGAGWNPGSAVSFAGYWDFGTGFSENAATQYMVIDDLVIADHWTGPPW